MKLVFIMQPYLKQTIRNMKDDLNIFKMEDDLNFLKMEDDLIFLKMEDDLNFCLSKRKTHIAIYRFRQSKEP